MRTRPEDLPKDNPKLEIAVLRYDWRGMYMGIMPTKIELTLEQSQQGVSNDVLSVGIKSLLNAVGITNAQVYVNTSDENVAPIQEDAKYEHVGQDTRSQGGKDDQDKQGKDLEISKSKTKSKDNDKGSRSKITQHEGTSIQHNKDQIFKNLTTKQSQQVQESKIQDLTLRIRRPHIRGDC
ncbi:hypothetical protein Tco_1083463 [Tanacetum coccineum]